MTLLWLSRVVTRVRLARAAGLVAVAVFVSVAIGPAREAPPSAARDGFALLPAGARPAIFQALNQHGGPAFAIHASGVQPASDDSPANHFEAANEPHGFGVVFNGDGVRIAPQAAGTEPLVVQLARFGEHDSAAPIAMGAWHADGPRIERASSNEPTSITEWYINGPAGLEQGFTVPEAPSGRTTLSVDLRVNDAWRVQTASDAQSMHLIERKTGTALSYSGLTALDARGQRLPASMTAGRGRITITVDAADAAYPVTIDPFIQQQKLTTPSGANNFGGAIAISGDTILVGASSSMVAGRFQGLAFVFVRNGTTWTQQAELGPADGATVEEFGASVSLAGNTAVVGAPREDVNGKVDQGAVYVFVRNGTSWSQQQRLLALDGNLDDAFGRSVSIDGNTVAIGSAESDVGGNADQGATYIFERVGTTWTQQQKLTAADGQSSDMLGSSISLNANTAVIGAFADDIGSNVDQGSVYVFTRTNGTWTLQQKLASSDGQANDAFGFSVAISGDRAFIGAPTDDLGGFVDRGTTSVFIRSAGVWTLEQQLAASDGRAGDRFGQRVAVVGDDAVIGASGHDDGAAYVFRRTGGSWTQGETLTPSDRTSRFSVVALDGSTIAVGSPKLVACSVRARRMSSSIRRSSRRHRRPGRRRRLCWINRTSRAPPCASRGMRSAARRAIGCARARHRAGTTRSTATSATRHR